MNMFLKLIWICASAVVCSVMAIPSTWATTEDVNMGQMSWEGKVSIGYRAVNAKDEHRRALEYSLLESGPTAGLAVTGFKDQRHLTLEANFLNDAEYYADAHLDYKGLFKANLNTESLYHNLDHIPYGSPFRNDAVFNGNVLVPFDDHDPGDNYHVEVERSSVQLRGKLPIMPAHLNLSYWRLERSGKQQLRFLDENCTSCHMQSQSRTLDRVTEEVTASMDAHLGPVDVIFEQLFRQFRDREPIPSDPFADHMLRSGSPPARQHDEAPDSRLTQSSLKLHTSLAGGLVGAATLSLGKRENRSDLVDVHPVESETDFRKAAGDVTYIPTPGLTLNFRYRLLDLDNSNTNQITAQGLILFDPLVDHNPVDVRDNVDLTRASYAATLSYRPSRAVTFKGDFERVDIHRGNTDGFVEYNAIANPIVIDPVWELPEDENIDRYRLSFYARPLGSSTLRFNGWYQYRTSDDPAYGTSAEDSHQVFFGGTWSPSQRWGTNANVKLVSETNNEHGMAVSDATDPVDGRRKLELDRRLESENLAASIWLNPTDSLGLSLNYAYLRNRTVQDLLFGNTIDLGLNASYATIDKDVEFSQQVHTTSLAANLRLMENLKASAMARYIQSFSNFNPGFGSKALDFGAGPVLIDASLLKELSEVDIRQTGLSIGLDWSPTEAWTCSARWRFDDYEDRNSSIFDGSVQTYVANVSRVW